MYGETHDVHHDGDASDDILGAYHDRDAIEDIS